MNTKKKRLYAIQLEEMVKKQDPTTKLIYKEGSFTRYGHSKLFVDIQFRKIYEKKSDYQEPLDFKFYRFMLSESIVDSLAIFFEKVSKEIIRNGLDASRVDKMVQDLREHHCLVLKFEKEDYPKSIDISGVVRIFIKSLVQIKNRVIGIVNSLQMFGRIIISVPNRSDLNFNLDFWKEFVDHNDTEEMEKIEETEEKGVNNNNSKLTVFI